MNYTPNEALNRAWFYIHNNQPNRAKIWMLYVIDELRRKLGN